MTNLLNVWVNPDGLAVKFGAEEGAVGKVTSFEDTWGTMNIASFHFDFTDVPALANVVSTSVANGILDYTTAIPKGSRIMDVKIITETAAVGSGATLDIGFVKDDYTTEYDYNGLVAVYPTTSMNADGSEAVIQVGTATYAGALLGTTLAFDGVPTVDYNTAAFTAGKWIVEIRYYVPITT